MFMNDQTGSFRGATKAGPLTTAAGATNAAALHDFNNDKHLDVYVVNYMDENELFLGDGKGGFTAAPASAANSGTSQYRGYALAVGDVNGDLAADIYVGNYYKQNNTLYIGNGKGSFTAGTRSVATMTISHTTGVAFADMDMDGNLDIFACNYKQANALFLGDGKGSFSDAPPSPATRLADKSEGVSIADIDGDNLLDVYISNAEGQANALYLGDGTGGFASTETSAVTMSTSNSMSANLEDIDGDGTIDVFVSNWDGRDELFLADVMQRAYTRAPGSVATAATDFTTAAAFGDVNDDGFLDLFVGNGKESIWDFGKYIYVTHTNGLYLGDGKGAFTAAPSSAATSEYEDTQAVAMGDLDGDGDLDLVAGNKLGNVSVYINDGHGSFHGAYSRDLAAAAGRKTTSVGLADVDNDHDLDLYVGNNGEHNALYINVGNGSFVEASAVASGVSTVGNDLTTVALFLDANNDNQLDIFVGNQGTHNALYYGDGKGNFSVAPTGILTSPTSSIDTVTACAADVNGDGFVDIFVGNRGQEASVLYLGTGNGFRAAPPSAVAAAGGKTTAAQFGDIDSDGDQDLIVGRHGEADMVFLNNGSGSYRQDVSFTSVLSASLSNTRAVLLGDVDSDGDVDVFIGNEGQDNQLYLMSLCEAGRSRTLGRAVSWCSLCPAHTRSVGGLCYECDGGQTAGAPGRSTCGVPCPSGTVRPFGVNATACRLCASGSVPMKLGAGNTACRSCPAAKYSPAQGQEKCLLCPKGTFQPDADASLCRTCGTCAAGSVRTSNCTRTNNTRCTPCAISTWANKATQACAPCTVCRATARNITLSACSPSTDALCLTCPHGTYSNGMACVACTSVSLGRKETAACSNTSDRRTALVTCSAPPVVPHAKVSSAALAVAHYGSVVRYTCEARFVGGGVIECKATGKWTSSPSCYTAKVNCGRLSVAHSLFITGNSSTERGAVKFVGCKQGTTGGGNSTCDSKGEWSPQPACTPCKEGTADVDGNAATPCVKCSKGSYATSSALKCLPCAVGTTDHDSDPATPCVNCATGRVAAAGATECKSCPAGSEPSFDAAQCNACQGKKYSPNGRACRSCQDTSTLPNLERTKCACPAGMYDRTTGLIFCFEGDVFDNPLNRDGFELSRAAVQRGESCLPCPSACTNCSVFGHVLIKPGYGLPEAHLREYKGLQPAGSGNTFKDKWLFSCKQNPEACRGESFNDTVQTLLTCPHGHTGPLCEQCLPGFAGGTKKPCQDCRTQEDLGVVWFVVGGLIVAALGFGLTLALRATKRLKARISLYQKTRSQLKTINALSSSILGTVGSDGVGGSIQEGIQELPTRIKILISNIQIVVQLPDVLQFEFGPTFKSIIGQLAVLKFSLGGVSLGCALQSDLYSKFAVTMATPIVILVLIKLKREFSLHRWREELLTMETRKAIEAEALKSCFLCFFLL